jgi:hypothetical protein
MGIYGSDILTGMMALSSKEDGGICNFVEDEGWRRSSTMGMSGHPVLLSEGKCFGTSCFVCSVL